MTQTRDCSICMDILSKKSYINSALVCGHVFHSSCIDEWLIKNKSCPTCPICRHPVVCPVQQCSVQSSQPTIVCPTVVRPTTVRPTTVRPCYTLFILTQMIIAFEKAFPEYRTIGQRIRFLLIQDEWKLLT